MHDLSIRPADDLDAPSIAAIYNFYVRTSTATFDTVERSVADQVERLRQHVLMELVLGADADEVSS